MKKLFKRLAICLALVTVLTVSAFAADYTHCADALKDLGLFQGGNSGYDLDRAPTRAEAATMLVRLLGQDAAAKELTYTAPFTDVPTWAQPYVQYLVDAGLTSGKTATSFDPNGKCTAQMYATFVMRALGYSDKDGGQFTYANAVAFATEKGVANAYNCDETNFLRDDVVAMSYTALATAPQDGAEVNLLQKLMKAGVIKDAKGLDIQFRTYREFIQAQPAPSTTDTKSHMMVDAKVNAKVSGVDLLNASMNFDMLMDVNAAKPDSSKVAMTGKVDMKINPLMVPENNTYTGDMAIYYTEGYYYMNMAGEKAKFPMSIADMVGETSAMAAASEQLPICLLKSISVSGSTYTVSLAPSTFNSMITTTMGAIEGIAANELPIIAFDKLDMTMTLSGGKLSKASFDMGLGMDVADQKMNMTMQMTMTDVGGTVNVVLPSDLSTYTQMTMPAA